MKKVFIWLCMVIFLGELWKWLEIITYGTQTVRQVDTIVAALTNVFVIWLLLID